jgi:hypothetical protein
MKLTLLAALLLWTQYGASAANDIDDNVLRIGFLPHLTNKGRARYYLGAFRLALEELEDTIWPLRLNYTYEDIKGSERQALLAMTQMKFDDVAAFIGPEDTCATEGILTSAWNIPLFTFVCVLSHTIF